MLTEEVILILILIFGFFLNSIAVLRLKIKFGIPIRETLRMVWQELVVDSFKELPSGTKKVMGTIWRYIKENRGAIWKFIKGIPSSIVKFFHPAPKPEKKPILNHELEYHMQDAVSDYASKSFPPVISGAYYPLPSYVCVSLYTKGAITEDEEAEIVWALKAKFQDYIRSYDFNFSCFPVPYTRNNHIEVYLLCLCELTIRVQQFKETADHLANGNRVTLIQILPKMIVFVQSIAVLFLPQFSDELRKVICDKAIVIRKMLRTEFRYFPSGYVTMHTVKKCRVRSHFRRERVKQTGSLKKNVHALIDVTHEHH